MSNHQNHLLAACSPRSTTSQLVLDLQSPWRCSWLHHHCSLYQCVVSGEHWFLFEILTPPMAMHRMRETWDRWMRSMNGKLPSLRRWASRKSSRNIFMFIYEPPLWRLCRVSVLLAARHWYLVYPQETQRKQNRFEALQEMAQSTKTSISAHAEEGGVGGIVRTSWSRIRICDHRVRLGSEAPQLDESEYHWSNFHAKRSARCISLRWLVVMPWG